MVGAALYKKITDPNVLGIDLGTTNSVVAVMRGNEPVVIRDGNGNNTVPSLVKLGLSEAVGADAQSYLQTDPQNTVFASKRLIGRKATDPEIQEYLKSLPYATVPSCNGDVWIKTDFGKFSPTQIAGKILSKMKMIGENYLKQPVSRAVVTVPAYFNDCQKQATKDAGRIAGLDVIRIINEPTAAALAYGLDKKATGHVAIYDLGGGTFDISILELDNGIFHVKSTNGDTFLGGEDFDSEIVKFLQRQYEDREGVKLTSPRSLTLLKQAAEKAKKDLSVSSRTRIIVPEIDEGVDLDVVVTRDQLESVVKRVAQRTVEPCERAIKDAKIKKEQIKHVVLVGGMTRMPYIRKLAESIFEIKPITEIDPDEAVAKGAAIQAGVLSGTVGDLLLLDVVPLSLGIEVAGGIFSKVVEKNTTLPFKRTETFTTTMDNQEYVDIRIFQGERPMVADNKYLGSVRLLNIPKAPKGVPKVDVCFEADANGITRVTAQDSITKTKQEVEITPAGGLSEEEIREMEEDARRHKDIDQKKMEDAEFKEAAMKLIEEYKNKDVPGNIRVKINGLAGTAERDLSAARVIYNELKKIL